MGLEEERRQGRPLTRAILTRLVAFCLIAEALFGALYVSSLLTFMAGYGAVAIALIIARGILGAVQFIAGWQLANHRPTAVVFARAALAGGAILTALIVGFNLAPTDIYHWYRWHYTAGYCVYAVLAMMVIQVYRSNDPSLHRSMDR